MPSQIKVDQIAGASGNTVTVPSGQTLDISSATLSLPSTIVTTTGTQTLTNKTIGVSQLTGTLPVANGGTGLTALGTAGQVIKVNSGATALEFGTAPSGKVLQVVSTTKTDTFTLSTGSTVFTDVTGLSATITPSSASNKILIIFSVNVSNTVGSILKVKLLRGSTDISIGDTASNRSRSTVGNYNGTTNDAHLQTMASNFLDSPSTTSATTYKIQIATESATMYVNRSGRDLDSLQETRSTSTITLMEISA